MQGFFVFSGKNRLDGQEIPAWTSGMRHSEMAHFWHSPALCHGTMMARLLVGCRMKTSHFRSWHPAESAVHCPGFSLDCQVKCNDFFEKFLQVFFNLKTYKIFSWQAKQLCQHLPVLHRKRCTFWKNWRISPLQFSLAPRCHGACGSAKDTLIHPKFRRLWIVHTLDIFVLYNAH